MMSTTEQQPGDRAPEKQPVVLLYQQDGSDGVDLIALGSRLWQGRWKIMLFTLIFVVLSAMYVVLTDPKYEAVAVLTPNSSTLGKALPSNLGGLSGLASLAGISLGPRSAETTEALAILNSRVFAEEFIRDQELLPVLFHDDWDSTRNAWKESDPQDQRTIEDGVLYFVESIRRVSLDDATGMVIVTIRWTDPAVAAAWAAELVERINERMRTRVLTEAGRRLDYLNKELANAKLVELRQAISQLIQEEIQTISLARAESEFAFKIVDPPRVPIKPVFPGRIVLIAVAAILGTVIGMFFVLFSSALSQSRSVN